MAVTMRQGLQSINAILGVYDSVPVVLYDSTVASKFHFRYVLVVYRRVGGTWSEIARLKRIPNSEGVGVFDLSQLLRGALEVLDPPNDAINTTTIPTSAAGTAETFRVQMASEYATTENGNIVFVFETAVQYYIVAVAARFLSVFESWGTPVLTDNFVLTNTSERRFLTKRTKQDFSYKGLPYTGYVVRVPRRDFKFTFSFLSTDGIAPWTTVDWKLYVGIGAGNTEFSNASVNLSNQDIDNTAFEPDDGAGGAIKNVHCGWTDIESFTWASSLAGNNTWEKLFVQIQPQSAPVASSVSMMFVLDDCTNDGVRFKFLNEYGGYDYVFCEGHTKMNVNYTREQYTTGTGNWHTANGLGDDILQIQDAEKRNVKSNVTQEQRKYQAHTGYLTKEENELVLALLASKRVYATRFVEPRVAPEPEYYPVVITNSSVKAMYQQTDKQVEYTIEFEYANAARPMV